MAKASREFQVFAKPAGAVQPGLPLLLLSEEERPLRKGESLRMSDAILEEYIVQHIDASPGSVIRFSWHGGEPTVLGLDYFRKSWRSSASIGRGISASPTAFKRTAPSSTRSGAVFWREKVLP